MDKMTNDSRKIALFILNTLDKRQKRLDSILEDILNDKEVLPLKRDRGLVYALVYGVLRWRGNLDSIISRFSKTPLNKIEPNILNILRLGLFQIIYLDKIPVSAAVNTSVEMAKSSDAPWIAKFVNGVLRNIARANETSHFSLLTSHFSLPNWLIKRWQNRFGSEEITRICNAINTIPPITIRTNTLKTSREELINAIKNEAERIESSISYAPDAISFFNPETSIPEMETFKKGWFQVQDEAAQLVAYMLNPKPGEMILDACSGLGGKTGHIAQLMNNSGVIFSVDKEEEKLQRLLSEMNRLGVSIVKTCVHDLNEPLLMSQVAGRKSRMASRMSRMASRKAQIADNDGQLFDRILVDSPCSGLGVLRRNPDAKWSVFKEDLTYYKKREIKILDNTAHLVKPFGIIIYAVCSTEPEENEEVVKSFLNKHPDFIVQKDIEGLPDKANSLITQDGYLRTFPHLNNMDGFFAVCFKRVG